MNICNGWLGVFGGILALLGVVAAPITSGDTALRSARLIIAEFLKLPQKAIKNRLYISIPMFICCIILLGWQISNPDGFNTIWSYFGWSNQSLAVFTLWTVTAFLARSGKNFIVTMVPALFMVWVCTTYILVAPEGFNIQGPFPYLVGVVVALSCLLYFLHWKNKRGNMLSDRRKRHWEKLEHAAK